MRFESDSKKNWTVSAADMVHRLHMLGLISDWHYRSLFIEIQRHGYRTKEPEEARPEGSQVWRKVFDLLREDGLTLNDLARGLSVPADELVKLVFGLVTVGLPGSEIATSTPKRSQLHLIKS